MVRLAGELERVCLVNVLAGDLEIQRGRLCLQSNHKEVASVAPEFFVVRPHVLAGGFFVGEQCLQTFVENVSVETFEFDGLAALADAQSVVVRAVERLRETPSDFEAPFKCHVLFLFVLSVFVLADSVLLVLGLSPAHRE